MTSSSLDTANPSDAHRTAATISLAAIGLAAVIMIALHFVKPELAPSWRMLSEYSIGANGWMMKVAFWLMALSNLGLAFALQRHAKTVAAKIGIGLHYIVAVALVGAGLYDMDPITIRPEQATSNGQMHGLTAMIGVPGQVLAALTLAWGLTRPRQIFEHSRAPILGSAIATLVALLLMFAYLAMAVPANGGFGPAVMAGWLNRLVVATFVAWLATAGSHARALGGSH
jgi:hypothetical protein